MSYIVAYQELLLEIVESDLIQWLETTSSIIN